MTIMVGIIKKKEFCSLVRRPVHYLMVSGQSGCHGNVGVTKDKAKYEVSTSNLARRLMALPL